MFSLLLTIIYMAFISLGLPDSLLGSAWPIMRLDFDTGLSVAGAITMTISLGTIISSLLSDRITYRFGTGLVTAISTAMTAIGLIGFSTAGSLPMFFIWAIPYGLGAGAIDAALNNYVALHYSSRHMSWLHCCWGVGVSISPYIMSYCLSVKNNWRMGYGTVSIIQLILAILLFISIPIWKKRPNTACANEQPAVKPIGLIGAFKIRGVPYVLIAFCCYCSLEATTGLWASSYLVEHRFLGAEAAASFASLFYLGITFGRFINGFIADHFGNRQLIRTGTLIILAGTVLVMLPVRTDIFALAGLIIIGFGCAPVYPCIIHSTPANFGEHNSQAIIGIQMASAYIGTTLIPPLFGLIAQHIWMGFYPFFLAVFGILLLIMSEKLNHLLRKDIT